MTTQPFDPTPVDHAENKRRMLAGELYIAFTPEFIAARARCRRAFNRLNTTTETSRRALVEIWRDLVQDERPLPPIAATPEEDAAQFDSTDPWIEPPLRADYGTQLHIAPGAYINSNSTFVDTMPITIGARTLVGPNCSFYSGVHPLDPVVRNGLEGPESGKPIWIGEDCWLGGNVTVLPGVTIGKGAVCGAGSVVTKDVPPFHVVAGNPARILRKIETEMDPQQSAKAKAKTKPPYERMRSTDFALG